MEQEKAEALAFLQAMHDRLIEGGEEEQCFAVNVTNAMAHLRGEIEPPV